MAELVVYPDVESLLVWYLGAEFGLRGEMARVGTKVPNPRPNRFVRITAAGGGERAIVLSSRTVIFECWDTDDPAASALAELSYAIMRAAQWDAAVPTIRNVATVGAPASFPDPDTGTSRYQFTLSVDLRGHVV